MSFPEYKERRDSGIERIGDVPSHWPVLPMKRFLARNEGGVWGDEPSGDDDTVVLRSTEQSVNGNWKIIEPAYRKLNALDKESARLRAGDLVVTKSSGSALHIGKTSLVDDAIESMECCFGNFMQRLRTLNSLQPRLAWYILNNAIARSQFDVLSNSTTGLANLNGTTIGNIVICVPPKDEQLRIVSFLDQETAKIDALIAEQQRLIELLKEKRQAVISHAVTKGLNPDVPMKDSGVEWLGEVPAQWAIFKLKYAISRFEQGWSPQCDNEPVRGEDEWGVLKVGCVNGGVFDPSENKRLPDDLTPNPSLAVDRGDVLVSRANTRDLVGSAAVVPEGKPNLMLSDKLFRLNFIEKQLDPSYVAAYLATRAVRHEIELEATGASSSMLNIGQATIKDLYLPRPPVGEQREIVAHLQETNLGISELQRHCGHMIATLTERRSALISAAVTGKIDVRNWKPKQRHVKASSEEGEKEINYA